MLYRAPLPISRLSHRVGVRQCGEHSCRGNLASPGAHVGMGLLPGIVDDPKNRRFARVRFRDGRPDRYIGLRPTRFGLAAAAPPSEEHQTTELKFRSGL